MLKEILKKYPNISLFELEELEREIHAYIEEKNAKIYFEKIESMNLPFYKLICFGNKKQPKLFLMRKNKNTYYQITDHHNFYEKTKLGLKDFSNREYKVLENSDNYILEFIKTYGMTSGRDMEYFHHITSRKSNHNLYYMYLNKHKPSGIKHLFEFVIKVNDEMRIYHNDNWVNIIEKYPSFDCNDGYINLYKTYLTVNSKDIII